MAIVLTDYAFGFKGYVMCLLSCSGSSLFEIRSNELDLSTFRMLLLFSATGTVICLAFETIRVRERLDECALSLGKRCSLWSMLVDNYN